MKFDNKVAVLAAAADNAKIDTQYDVAESLFAVIPFRDTTTGSFRRCAAYIERMEGFATTSIAHTVVLAYDGDGFYWWCGDSFLAGKYNAVDRDNALKVARSSAEESKMRELFGKYKDSECGFWSGGGERCKHTDNLAASITESVLDQLEALFNGGSVAKRKTRRDPEAFIKKRLFKKHVKLEGPKGGGKTYLARKIAEENADLVINIAGSEKTDSAELEGHLVPHAERIPTKGQRGLFESNEQIVQTFVFKYGRLARAFRAARSGIKTIVVIDEGYRIPPEQMQLLVTALSPYKGNYILPVSNMIESEHEWEDGLVEEEIWAPVENLMVIMTTNVGSNYLVEGIDEALQDRFHTIQVPEDRAVIEAVIASTLLGRGFAPHIKDQLMEFFDKMKRLQDDKRITRDINMRHMVEIVETSVDEDDISETIYEMHTQWASLSVDGIYDPQEIRAIEKIIESIF